jgi:hypothetical protein
MSKSKNTMRVSVCAYICPSIQHLSISPFLFYLSIHYPFMHSTNLHGCLLYAKTFHVIVSAPHDNWIRHVSLSQRGELSLREVEVNFRVIQMVRPGLGFTLRSGCLFNPSSSHAREEQMVCFSSLHSFRLSWSAALGQYD